MAVRYAALCRKVHVCHCNSLGGATWRSITGRTDRRTDRVRRNMRPPPREEGRIISRRAAVNGLHHSGTTFSNIILNWHSVEGIPSQVHPSDKIFTVRQKSYNAFSADYNYNSTSVERATQSLRSGPVFPAGSISGLVTVSPRVCPSVCVARQVQLTTITHFEKNIDRRYISQSLVA